MYLTSINSTIPSNISKQTCPKSSMSNAYALFAYYRNQFMDQRKIT